MATRIPKAVKKPSDGGKKSAIKTAAKKAAKILDEPIEPTSEAFKQAFEPEATAAPAEPNKPNSVQRVIEAFKLYDAMDTAHTNLKNFLSQFPENARDPIQPQAMFLEQWFAIVPKYVTVPTIPTEQFDKWVTDHLVPEVKPGSMIGLQFESGRRGVALGTIIKPIVLYQHDADFVHELKRFNPADFPLALMKPELLPKVAIHASLPPELLACLSHFSTDRLTLDYLHDVFGNPFLYAAGIPQKTAASRFAFAQRYLDPSLNRSLQS